jgi:adenine-specific DNA-methyltransferase
MEICLDRGCHYRPRIKTYLSETEGVSSWTWWPNNEVGHNQEAKKEILEILGADKNFDYPKPVRLLSRILEIATPKDAIVLDSFAGSGTTAHAVLQANRKDNGQRKFILVECENYADTITAERVRRVINGYSFKGTQKEVLYTESISFTSLKKSNKILDQIASIENLEKHRFDKIKKEIKNDTLTVIGEKKITEQVDGTGGSFTYCTLGEPIDIDKILTGENLPDYQSIGSWLFHTATGEALDVKNIKEKDFFLGESNAYCVWLIYKPSLEFLKSRDAALTLAFAEKIAQNKNKKHLVFAPAKYVPNKTLLPLGVEYAPLPFALYRVEK